MQQNGVFYVFDNIHFMNLYLFWFFMLILNYYFHLDEVINHLHMIILFIVFGSGLFYNVIFISQ